ncbi:MAG: adenosylcobinamide-GDP ribazoletransferase [Candidatus Omnitrophica bacterium]|jgi:adenosylcobinamide-GDP ribazoletransferase|nr:adenosylcobinamide-GDP ribazoletransferase [Candidatus Omnitrophota bacterium]
MQQFLLALQFLSVIPVKVKKYSEKKAAESMVYFPFVGLFLGVFVADLRWLLHFWGLPFISINLLSVIMLIILTAGIHLDGVADTFDAIGSGKSKEEKLSIMRDPHIGAIGVLAIVSILFLKIAALLALPLKEGSFAIILSCVTSRFAMAGLISFFPYARQSGKAEAFIKNSTNNIFILALIMAVVCVSLVDLQKGLGLLAISTLVAFLLGNYFKRSLGGVTGDICGAVNEISETLCLLLWGVL